ncbi:YaaL family protein [Paenibacillus sp. P96]|uniref:YaaL family protein n=1 Tax=Paenibacillus zeirhizosphaerae TaxID=2987519 RepID=A0ABT9FX51_9BACL|nr:DUF2508 family protein [Paenibacillus sp. P96]MDP4099215.1 YaaL family protein [Paenibacillus sp. P96]
MGSKFVHSPNMYVETAGANAEQHRLGVSEVWTWNKRKLGGPDSIEYQTELFADVCAAHADWVRAQRMFQEAVGEDQIDYAIFVLEAAERKYQIQLKKAKQSKLHRLQIPADIAWAIEGIAWGRGRKAE